MEKFSYRSLLPWVIAIIAVALLAFRSDTSAQRPTVVNTGRYQLFVGTYNGHQDGKDTETKSIFKIDTETGATWYYLTESEGKTSLEGWAPISNLVKRQ